MHLNSLLDFNHLIHVAKFIIMWGLIDFFLAAATCTSVQLMIEMYIDILPLFISQALYYTGNSNADLAAAWVIENQHRSNIDAPLNVSRVIVKCWLVSTFISVI